MRCCGGNRSGRYCTQCGAELVRPSDPLAELLSHVSTGVMAREKDLKRALEHVDDDPEYAAYWRKIYERYKAVVSKWKSWEEALKRVVEGKA